MDVEKVTRDGKAGNEATRQRGNVGNTGMQGIEAKAEGKEVVRQQNVDAWDMEGKGVYTTKQRSQGGGPVGNEGHGVAGKKRWRRWNPLRRWLSELPTPDFNLKI